MMTYHEVEPMLIDCSTILHNSFTSSQGHFSECLTLRMSSSLSKMSPRPLNLLNDELSSIFYVVLPTACRPHSKDLLTVELAQLRRDCRFDALVSGAVASRYQKERVDNLAKLLDRPPPGPPLGERPRGAPARRGGPHAVHNHSGNGHGSHRVPQAAYS